MEYLLMTLAVVAILSVLAAGWVMTLLSLPGNWLMVVGVAVFGYLVPNDWRVDVGTSVVVSVLLLAIVGEILESLTVAFGTSRAGGSKRSAFLALCGSIGGGLFGGMLGLPIPIVGPVIAVLLGAAFGATAGAMIGESWKGRSAEEGWEVGKAAFWGRLLGTLGKIGTASVIVVVTLAALLVR